MGGRSWSCRRRGILQRDPSSYQDESRWRSRFYFGAIAASSAAMKCESFDPQCASLPAWDSPVGSGVEMAGAVSDAGLPCPEPRKRLRPIGLAKGTFELTDAFFEPLPDD